MIIELEEDIQMADAIFLVPCDPVAIINPFEREFCRGRDTGVGLILKKSSQAPGPTRHNH